MPSVAVSLIAIARSRGWPGSTHLGFQPPQGLDLLFGGLIKCGEKPNPDFVAALPNDIGRISGAGWMDLQQKPARDGRAGGQAKPRTVFIEIANYRFDDLTPRTMCDPAPQDAPIPASRTAVGLGSR